MSSCMITLQNPAENSSLKVESAARVSLFSKILWPCIKDLFKQSSWQMIQETSNKKSYTEM